MFSTLRPRSRSSTRRPFSVSSLAAQPPEMPDPTTIASYSDACIESSGGFTVKASRLATADVALRNGSNMAREPRRGECEPFPRSVRFWKSFLNAEGAGSAETCHLETPSPNQRGERAKTGCSPCPPWFVALQELDQPRGARGA